MGGVVVSLRGTSGSGKSTAVHQLLRDFPHTTIFGRALTARERTYHPRMLALGTRLPAVRGLDLPLTVVGPYHTTCGGCDFIKTQDEIQERVRQWAEDGHVLFEGYVASASYSRWAKMAEEEMPGRFVFAFLDTPRDVCESRVRARRAAERGAGAAGQVSLFGEEEAPPPDEYDPRNLTAVWHGTRKVRQKVLDAGLMCVDVDHQADPLYGPVVRAIRDHAT